MDSVMRIALRTADVMSVAKRGAQLTRSQLVKFQHAVAVSLLLSLAGMIGGVMALLSLVIYYALMDEFGAESTDLWHMITVDTAAREPVIVGNILAYSSKARALSSVIIHCTDMLAMYFFFPVCFIYYLNPSRRVVCFLLGSAFAAWALVAFGYVFLAYTFFDSWLFSALGPVIGFTSLFAALKVVLPWDSKVPREALKVLAVVVISSLTVSVRIPISSDVERFINTCIVLTLYREFARFFTSASAYYLSMDANILGSSTNNVRRENVFPFALWAEVATAVIFRLEVSNFDSSLVTVAVVIFQAVQEIVLRLTVTQRDKAGRLLLKNMMAFCFSVARPSRSISTSTRSTVILIDAPILVNQTLPKKYTASAVVPCATLGEKEDASKMENPIEKDKSSSESCSHRDTSKMEDTSEKDKPSSELCSNRDASKMENPSEKDRLSESRSRQNINSIVNVNADATQKWREMALQNFRSRMLFFHMFAEYAGMYISFVVLAYCENKILHQPYRAYRKTPALLDGASIKGDLVVWLLVQIVTEIVTDSICIYFEARHGLGVDLLQVWQGFDKTRMLPMLCFTMLMGTFVGTGLAKATDDMEACAGRNMCYCVGNGLLEGGVREMYCLILYPNSTLPGYPE